MERVALGDSVRRVLLSAYTFDSANVLQRFMSVYPDSGRVVSAASGAFTVERDSVASALSAFWEGAGKRMRRPRWIWGPIIVDVLSRDAVAITADYTVPHWTPDGAGHVIGGVWTSVWVRRGGRWVIIQEHLSDMPRAAAERLEAGMRPLADSGRSQF